ncbi:MAG: hypothetical protein JWO32_2614 [Bacteroidetes bacterium]|nr:hypothetical protein [Bacteroidota bacterium]
MTRVLLLLLVFCSKISSQSIANYSTVRNTAVPYTSIGASGFAFNNWRNITTYTQDDNRSDFTDIGFDFWYNGTRYTQFCVSTNGFIDFSSSANNGGAVANAFGYDNTSFTNSSAANGTRPAIAPFYDDLTAQGGSAALGNSIKYLLTGSAPNRTLTIEWINMAVYLNTTPSLNFQVKLVETTGQILINYGTMNTGTKVFSYSMGMNSATLGVIPAASELKMLQTVNTNSLSNAVQNNLSAMPAANSQYVFTSPAPTPTAGALTFSSVTQSSMTLNWPNWATNEVGYVIYNSTDGINFNFVSQLPANTVSASVTGLTSNTLYTWKLYAVTEGCLSNPLNGVQATTIAGSRVSVATGNWSAAATWSPLGVPSAGEDVTIANGHVVSITSTATCNSLLVGQGTATTLQFSGTTARSFTINNNLTVSANAVFNVQLTSNVTHSLNVKGNIINNNILDFASDVNSLCDVTISKNGNQSLTGAGALTRFNLITMNLGSSANNIFNVASSTFSAAPNFLTLINGTFKLSSINPVTITLFTPLTTIPQTCGVWLNSATAVLNSGAGITLTGKMTVSNGTLNVGNAADEDLLSSGGTLLVTGGQVNIAGKYYATGINNLCYFTMTGGTVTVPNSGSSSSTIAPFQIVGAGSKFIMSGGLLVIPREGGTGAQDLGFINTVPDGSVTGGTVQIGSAATNSIQTININTNFSIGNLSVNSPSVTARINTNTLNVVGDVVINTGTLNVNNMDLALGGKWNHIGGAFTTGTAVVTFSSSGAQSIFKAGGETFYNLCFTGSGVKTFSAPVTTSANFSITAGAPVDVSTSNNQLTVKGNFINNGTFNSRSGLVYFNGTTPQTIGGTSVTDFNDITLSNSAGASLSGAENLLGTLTLTTGIFNTNAKVFTMVSTATACARIAQITGSGDITGNVTVQRFAPAGTTGWSLFGTPISSPLTFADWNDDFGITCPTCPDGFPGSFYSVYSYDETFPGLYDAAASYIPVSNITDPLVSNKGYWVYFGNGQYTTTDITIDVTGTVRKFNNTIPLNYTNFGSPINDGWNLIHNPYPSPISWSALKGATPNIDNAIYVYNTDLNAGAGGFATYVNGVSSPAVGAGGVGNTIPMSQAFYVHSTGPATLTAQEANKVAGNPTYLKTNIINNNAGPLVRIVLDGVYGFNDETVLYLQPLATDTFDEGFDSYKMRGQDPYAPTIALEKGTDQFQINGVAPIAGNFSMPLKTLTGYAGTYTISAPSFTSFPHGACINLYDKFLNTTTDISTTPYVFNLADTTTVARFDVNITMLPLLVNTTMTQPSCQLLNSGQVVASGANAGPWNYYWTTNGTPIQTSLNKTTADTLNNLPGGTIDLEVNTVGMCDNSSSTYQINSQIPSYAQFNSADTLDLNLFSSITFTNLSSGAVSYLWDFGDGSGTSINSSPTYYYSFPGTYTVTLICWSSTGCSDTTTKVITVTSILTDLSSNGGSSTELVVKTKSDNEFIFERAFNEEQSISFRLTDACGRLIQDYGTITAKAFQLPVELKNFAPGIYLMTITTGTSKKVVKLPVK